MASNGRLNWRLKFPPSWTRINISRQTRAKTNQLLQTEYLFKTSSISRSMRVKRRLLSSRSPYCQTQGPKDTSKAQVSQNRPHPRRTNHNRTSIEVFSAQQHRINVPKKRWAWLEPVLIAAVYQKRARVPRLSAKFLSLSLKIWSLSMCHNRAITSQSSSNRQKWRKSVLFYLRSKGPIPKRRMSHNRSHRTLKKLRHKLSSKALTTWQNSHRVTSSTMIHSTTKLRSLRKWTTSMIPKLSGLTNLIWKRWNSSLQESSSRS